jgi:dipeptidyl aminopeptidase/acylaminoacyl peptidase
MFVCIACNVYGFDQESTGVAKPKDPTRSVGCAPAAFLTFESGKLAGVDWVNYGANQVHTRIVLTQSRVVDATIDLRPDQTAAHSSVVLSLAGGEPEKPKVRDLGEGAIYWSDFIVSSVEQAIARARVLGQPSSKIVAASLYSDSRGEVLVERSDATDWVVSYHNKRYEVLTDEQGCMLAATLPEHGVMIERRAEFGADQYPLWAPYAAPPDGAYQAEEVSIPAPQGHVLVGTLTKPSGGQGKLPAAVLITGLSPSERNGGDPPWMPLRDLADSLTRAGIAVLRVDDRGVGKSTGDHAPSTTFDEADDVRTEVAWLRLRHGIDPKRIALVGYSEGGLIAPMVASGDPMIAAIVTLEGPGTSGSDLARYQSSQKVLHDPSIPPSEQEKAIAKQLADDLKDLSPRESVLLTIDPIPFARRVRCPTLIIQGGSDLHVPVRSAQRIAAAIRSNGNSDVTVRIFPGVSHSLLPDPLGLNSGWVLLPGFLTSPQLLDVMAQWASGKLGTTGGH